MAAASLDIMNDVLLKFGHMMGSEQAQLKDILLQGLVDPKPVIRKRSINCLGKSSVTHMSMMIDTVLCATWQECREG